jgi:hypothetical protein
MSAKKYRMLKAGERIHKGDEIDMNPWESCVPSVVGMRVSCYGEVRRPITAKRKPKAGLVPVVYIIEADGFPVAHMVSISKGTAMRYRREAEHHNPLPTFRVAKYQRVGGR